MEQTTPTFQTNDQLIESIFAIIKDKGLKATTMDYVAAKLSMSKRTLYEIFGSKTDMLRYVISTFQERHIKHIEKIFSQSETVMEAIYRTLVLNECLIKEVSVEFFHDMDSYYKELRKDYDSVTRKRNEDIESVITLGVKQGVFRSDANYRVTVKMLGIQMESLKRMEEFLPSDVTLTEALETIIIGFLRSIATPKGLEILEEIQKSPAELP